LPQGRELTSAVLPHPPIASPFSYRGRHLRLELRSVLGELLRDASNIWHLHRVSSRHRLLCRPHPKSISIRRPTVGRPSAARTPLTIQSKERLHCHWPVDRKLDKSGERIKEFISLPTRGSPHICSISTCDPRARPRPIEKSPPFYLARHHPFSRLNAARP
jgi:hypothetical protein